MTWEALGAIGEVVGAVGVVVTLAYLSVQIRNANKQAELESLRHTYDSLNQFCDRLSGSVETASIINRGRESLSSLTADELLMFEHIHIRLLNNLESWHLQIVRTSPPGRERERQLDNLSGIASGYLGFAGTRELWSRLGHYFVPIRSLVDGALVVED